MQVCVTKDEQATLPTPPETQASSVEDGGVVEEMASAAKDKATLAAPPADSSSKVVFHLGLLLCIYMMHATLLVWLPPYYFLAAHLPFTRLFQTNCNRCYNADCKSQTEFDAEKSCEYTLVSILRSSLYVDVCTQCSAIHLRLEEENQHKVFLQVLALVADAC